VDDVDCPSVTYAKSINNRLIVRLRQ